MTVQLTTQTKGNNNMKPSHKTFLDDVINKIMTSPHIEYYLDAGLIKSTTISWGYRYNDKCDIEDIGYIIYIDDKYSIDVNEINSVYEIIDYIDNIMPLIPLYGPSEQDYYSCVYYHHHTKRYTTTK